MVVFERTAAHRPRTTELYVDARRLQKKPATACRIRAVKR
jgi:hypothetical protein